ncbi:MAG: hypothetical protein O7G85_13555, partial [Planctomycetota bacterium]|nr:hypothetical protein [Planctomycetota bacterium]
FITIGTANRSMKHIAHVFSLQGRVPVLNLGLVHPVDEPAIERILTRCEQVVVLEPRPGTIELSVLRVAEALRRQGEQIASVWGERLPPDEQGMTHEMNSDEDLHPSVLVRKISHLLAQVRGGASIKANLTADPPGEFIKVPPRTAAVGSDAVLSVVRQMLRNAERWLRDEAPLEERDIEPTSLAIDGRLPETTSTRIVQVETWGHRRFQLEGQAALIQATKDVRPWIFVVCESAQSDGQDFERIARSAVPSEQASRVKIEIGNLDDQNALEAMLHEAVLSEGLFVLIVRDGPPARYDVAAIETSMQEIDRLGYRPNQRIVRPVDYACTLQYAAPDLTEDRLDVREPKAIETTLVVDRQSRRAGSGFRIRLRPLSEQIEVIRTRPPARIWRNMTPSRLPLPKPIHGNQPQWRAHLAGFRNLPPGVAAMVLCEAGRNMDFIVRSIFKPTPIGAGRRAWTEILFTQSGESAQDISATVPFGECDLLLGIDVLETIRAMGPDPTLRVVGPLQTCAVINIGHHQDEVENEDSRAVREQLCQLIESGLREETRFHRDFSKACRRSLGSERLTDVALLGASFQLGFIPVTFDAILEALKRVEARGYGSIVDAFEFGRRLVLTPELFARTRDEHDEGVLTIARRIELMLIRTGPGRRIRSSRYRSLVDRSLKAMPGLAESDAGRKIRRLYVVAMHRCMIWGGFDYAEQYVDLIIQLYHADRGDKARHVTRHAILPLAEAMLVRDPIYIASMVCSPEQRNRTRKRLNVKRAREDVVELRYLTRFEATLNERRLRMDLRSSDWSVKLLAASRRIMPDRWRGSRREREMREFVMEFIRRATLSNVPDYDTASKNFLILHELAFEGRLRQMTVEDLKRMMNLDSNESEHVTATSDTPAQATT